MNSSTTIRADFDIRDFGARMEIAPAANREAINRAITAASAAGGGRVIVPPGEWRTGTVELKSGVELHLEKGAVLKGSDRQADYNPDDIFPENFHSVGEEWSGGHLILGKCFEFRPDLISTPESVYSGRRFLGYLLFLHCQYLLMKGMNIKLLERRTWSASLRVARETFRSARTGTPVLYYKRISRKVPLKYRDFELQSSRQGL